MSIPKSELPTLQELTVDEIALGGVPLLACSKFMHKYCYEQSKEFMLCSKEEKDPRKCLSEGKEVTRCGIEFLNKMKTNCAKEFYVFWNCLSRSSSDQQFRHCRRLQHSYEGCMTNKMGLSPPILGEMSKTHVHHTKRPKPVRVVPLPKPMEDYPKNVTIAEGVQLKTTSIFD